MGRETTRLPRYSVALYQEPEVQGALLCFEVKDGDVLALVGGRDFDESEFNRVTQARRQPGSAFKPIIYAAALGRDFTPASIIYDRPVVYDDPESGFTWRPENYGRRFLGRLTIGEALARSVNNATIHLLKDVGIDYMMDFARHLGIEAPLERNLGLALGSNPVSLLELTRAYAVFPAKGREVKPRFIRRVLDREGNVLLEDLLLGESRPRGSDANGRGGGRNEAGEDELRAGRRPTRRRKRAEPEALPPGQLIARPTRTWPRISCAGWSTTLAEPAAGRARWEGRWPARPGRPTTRGMRGSSASLPTSPRGCGSATTRSGSSAAGRPGDAPRFPSGSTSWTRRSAIAGRGTSRFPTASSSRA